MLLSILASLSNICSSVTVAATSKDRNNMLAAPLESNRSPLRTLALFVM
jgi:hypothetical protein